MIPCVGSVRLQADQPAEARTLRTIEKRRESPHYEWRTNGSAVTTAGWPATTTEVPGARKSRCRYASAIGRASAGEVVLLVTCPITRLPTVTSAADAGATVPSSVSP